MSAHSQHLLALDREQFCGFKDISALELHRCQCEHLAQQRQRLDELLLHRASRASVAAIRAEWFSQKPKPTFEKLFTAKAAKPAKPAQQPVPEPPALRNMPTLTPAQRRKFAR